MDFLEQLSDNQVALIGCFAAVACCSVLMTIAYHFGKGRDQKSEEAGTYSPTVPFTPSVSARSVEESEFVEERRAA